MTSTHNSSTAFPAADATAAQGEYAIERVEPRIAAALVPSIEGMRLLPVGVPATLVNISTRGALILCCKKLGAGMAIRIVFEGASAPPPVGAKVVRSLVSKIGAGGELWYQVGVTFDEPVAFEAPHEKPHHFAVEPAPPKFVNRW